jgi:uncharacterized phage-like protein YoqJ
MLDVPEFAFEVPVPEPGDDPALYVMVSGHRPHMLGGYGEISPELEWACGRAEFTLQHLRQYAANRGVVLLSGMALGVDQILAAAALRHNIALHAVVPFVGQDEKWGYTAKQQYTAILGAAWKVTVLRQQAPRSKGQAVQWLQERNAWMAQYVAKRHGCGITVWNGEPSGTAHAVSMQRALRVPLVHINPGTRWCEVDPLFPGVI